MGGLDYMHRYMLDGNGRKYFGYDLSIAPVSSGTFRVSFRPLSLGTEEMGLKPAGAWSEMPLPQLPAPQVVHTGDTIVLDLFVHPLTGQKIVDYLFIGDDRLVRLPDGAPRDFTVDDAPLRLAEMRVTVNGKKIEGWTGGASGETVFFYVPGQGRYLFSLAPHADLGFRKAGEVRGSTLTVTWGSDALRFDCSGPIAPGGGAFNVYVYCDRDWRPAQGMPDAFVWGGGDTRRLLRRP